MGFEKYYGGIARKNRRNIPHADEAKRDYLAAVRQAIDGMLGAR